jgi:hypothetical protein
MILLTLQDLPPGYIIECDCGEFLMRDEEGDYDCPSCGVSY